MIGPSSSEPSRIRTLGWIALIRATRSGVALRKSAATGNEGCSWAKRRRNSEPRYPVAPSVKIEGAGMMIE